MSTTASRDGGSLRLSLQQLLVVLLLIYAFSTWGIINPPAFIIRSPTPFSASSWVCDTAVLLCGDHLSYLLCFCTRARTRARTGKRRYSSKLWRTFTDCFNCLPIAATVDGKIFCAHGGLSPELFDLEQINRVARPTDVPDTGTSCCCRAVLCVEQETGWKGGRRAVCWFRRRRLIVFGLKYISRFISAAAAAAAAALQKPVVVSISNM